MVATSSNIFAGAIGENSVNVIGSIKNVVTENFGAGVNAAQRAIGEGADSLKRTATTVATNAGAVPTPP